MILPQIEQFGIGIDKTFLLISLLFIVISPILKTDDFESRFSSMIATKKNQVLF